MTTPWPGYDSETQTVMCCLCFESKGLQELSKDADGNLTDVCLVCRQKELQAVLGQIAAIMDLPEKLLTSGDSTVHPDDETTQELTPVLLPCGHLSTCWCKVCHVCENS